MSCAISAREEQELRGEVEYKERTGSVRGAGRRDRVKIIMPETDRWIRLRVHIVFVYF